jgi:putative Holliday junction resolvase
MRTGLARVLGVDLGSRRIGLALSDPAGTLASPHDVLQRSGDRTRDHQAILAVARESDAGRIVVGLPRSMSGKDGPAARATRDEVAELAALAGDEFAVETYDERLTTVTAERTLVAAGVRREARRRVIDKVAAAVMLQGWLERHA